MTSNVSHCVCVTLFLIEVEVTGKKRKGRPSKTWEGCLMKYVDVTGLKKADAEEHNCWIAALRHHASSHPPEGGK